MVGVLQALTATFLVDIALIAVCLLTNGHSLLRRPSPSGAIATATAPAATLMVVRQYKAKGPLVDLLLPIVALDDAVGLVVFAVSFGIAKAMNVGAFDLVSIFVNPLLEIVCSLVLGAVMGWLLTQLEKLFNSNTNRLNMTIAFVFLTAALAMQEFEIGPVTDRLFLAARLHDARHGVLQSLPAVRRDHGQGRPVDEPAFRRVLRHIRRRAGSWRVRGQVDRADRPCVHCDALARQVPWRALFCKADEMRARQICKYLGITLLPQAGVALGMCVTARALANRVS